MSGAARLQLGWLSTLHATCKLSKSCRHECRLWLGVIISTLVVLHALGRLLTALLVSIRTSYVQASCRTMCHAWHCTTCSGQPRKFPEPTKLLESTHDRVSCAASQQLSDDADDTAGSGVHSQLDSHIAPTLLACAQSIPLGRMPGMSFRILVKML